ncbi:MAG: bacterial regulatory, gntR family protein [Rhodospirillales bacterium]|jgi:GntR family transcriptional regulator/MocR family aminotransferase|nr:bacterial regulatory, gntR family protein [Rhodospirillales bacterium]
MSARAGGILLQALIEDDPEGDALPRYVRLQGRLRRAILDGALTPGARLPSSRALARDLDLARNTVEAALAALEADGFVERRRGSGSFVADPLPAHALPPSLAPERESTAPRCSVRGRSIAAIPGQIIAGGGGAFSPSLPAMDLFPRALWAKLLARAARGAGAELWGYAPSPGLKLLREAIAAHVAATRGARVDPGRVIVTTSSQQALALAASVLLDPGDDVWIEEPGWRIPRALMHAVGANVVPVPVDDEGLDVAAGIAAAPNARLAYVTPAHQFPTGVELSPARRRALLQWAEESDAVVVEDDYDGDFRYVGRPLASLQASGGARTIYVGTFNKMLFPSLRLAFAIVPDALVDAMVAAKHLFDGHTATLAQAGLAHFILDGHLRAHLAAMRAAYDERRLALIDAVAGYDDLLVLGPSNAGTQVAAWARAPIDDIAAHHAAAQAGVDLQPLSTSFAGPPQPGFLLGFASSSPSRIRAAAAVLPRAIEAAGTSREARVVLGRRRG